MNSYPPPAPGGTYEEDGYSQPPAGPYGPQPAVINFRPAAERPIVVYTLLGITLVVFALQFISQIMYRGTDLPALYGMKINQYILEGQLWRLFTPMFLHGGLLHIGFNMYALNIFGPGLERSYGHWRFLLLYLLAGFAGNVASFLFTQAPSLGSSTAIFGLLGAEGVFLYKNRQVFGGRTQRALSNIVTIAVINLVIGLSPGIDNWGHVGGLLGGTMFAWLGGPMLRVEGIYPSLELVDQHDSGDALRSALFVGTLFAVLAAAAIVLRN